MADLAEQERVVAEMVRLVVEVSDAISGRPLLMNQSDHRRAVAAHIYARLACRANVADEMLAPGTLADALSDILYTYLYRILHESEPSKDLVARVAKETVALAESRSGSTTGLGIAQSALSEAGAYAKDYEELALSNASLQRDLTALKSSYAELDLLLTQVINEVAANGREISPDTIRTWRARQLACFFDRSRVTGGQK